MSGSHLLDTNILIAIFAQDMAVHQRLAVATEVFVSSIALGELYYGAYKSARVAANSTPVAEFAANSAVLMCDSETARQYGQIKAALRVKGRPIPENDIWISAIAMQYQLTLATRDEHFNSVDGSAVEMW